MGKANYFIRQFGNPSGNFGIFLANVMNMSNKRMYKANAAHLKGHKRILEIGYGNGKQLQMIKEMYPNISLYGVDISEAMYSTASERLRDSAMLSVGDAGDLSFQSSFFDAVITTDTCYFWNDPVKVLTEIRRVLKDDGIFINTFNTMYADSVRKTRNDECIYDLNTTNSIARKCHMVTVDHSKIGRFKEQIVLRKE